MDEDGVGGVAEGGEEASAVGADGAFEVEGCAGSGGDGEEDG